MKRGKINNPTATTQMKTVKSTEKMKSRINLREEHSSSMLVPCHRQAQGGLERTESIVAAKRSKKEEASKVVMVAEEVCFLPFDMVADILSRLPVKSLIRFRCACKQWCSLTYDPDFVKDQHKRALDRPALVSQAFMRNRVSLYHFGDDDEFKRSSFCIEFGKLKFRRFLSNSINGLVCVSSINGLCEDDGCFYLLNPSTREVAELPRSASNERNVNVGLGFDVSTGEYKVVKIREGTSNCCCCEVLSVGTREWRYVGDVPCKVIPWSPLFLNGAIHWIIVRYDRVPFASGILVFNLKDEKIRVLPIPERRHLYSEWCLCLTAYRGQLCSVRRARPFFKDPGHFFRIWSLRDYTSHEWVKEYDVDISYFATMFLEFSIIAIRGHKIIFRAYFGNMASLQNGAPGEEQSAVVYSYDIACGTARELYRGEMESVGLFTESLFSPRNLVGNLPL